MENKYYARCYDVEYHRVKFDSFVKLVEIKKENKRFNPGVSLRYEGDHNCGNVEICVTPTHDDVRDEFLEIAGKTLRLC